MVPSGNYMDPNLDLLAYYISLGNNHAQAILNANIKPVVNLSTIGPNSFYYIFKNYNFIIIEYFFLSGLGMTA